MPTANESASTTTSSTENTSSEPADTTTKLALNQHQMILQ